MFSFFPSRSRWCAWALGLLLVVLLAGNAAARGLLFVRDGSLWIADSHGRGQRKFDCFAGQPIDSAAFSPDGKLAVVAAGRDELTGLAHMFSLPVNGQGPQPLSMGRIRAAYCPAFSWDGKSVVLVGASDARRTGDTWSVTLATMSVAVVGLQGGRVRTILSTPDAVLDAGYIYSNPSFAPDGRRIAYQESGSDVSGGFVIVDLAGRVEFRYPPGGSNYPPFWKPQFLDAHRVLCWSPDASGGGKNAIFVVNLKTGARRRLTMGANPTLVDRRRAIVFERWSEAGNARSASDLWRLELTNGARPVRIISNGREPAGAAP